MAGYRFLSTKRKEYSPPDYTYSTDSFKTSEEYLERYPNDYIIDILDFGIYDRGSDYASALKDCLATVTEFANEKEKIPTVSESGDPLAKNTEWWSMVLEIVHPYQFYYFWVWRNPKAVDHGAFAPYKNSPDSKDFVKFYNDPKTLFQKDVSKERLYE